MRGRTSGSSPAVRQRMRHVLIGGIVALAASALVIGIGVVGVNVQNFVQSLSARSPAVGTRIVTPTESKAALAANGGLASPQAPEHREAAEYLAAQPTAYWLTPELEPIDEIWDRIAHLAQQARTQDAALAVVVYGLPGRDCGNFSAGGLDPGAYEAWTQRIGDALRNAQDLQKIVVLEPDSLALAPQCGNLDERVAQLTGAVERLSGINTWIYLDGGHSGWLPAREMADLLRRVGAPEKVRGFATNVSNYQTTSDEFEYAHEVSALLGGAHAIVDTSRNGAGPAGSEWCNPRGRLIGDPGGTYGDDVVDTNLWIKPPGESDGACNGGPAAGAWWPEVAAELTRELH